MHAKRLAGLLSFLLVAGCARVGPAPRSVEPAAKAPPAPAENPPAPERAPPEAAMKAPPAASAKVPPAPAVTRAPAPVVKAAPAKAPASPAPAASPPSQAEAAPALDLTTLEARLKETEAIGVFTKLALKNQVDDLLDQFRAFYRGQARISLAELRQPYDRLLLKVLSLLQDSDPELAHAIVTSREAIWSILADPARFATL